MKNIEEYYGKNIIIITNKGDKFSGKADYYEPPQDNDGQECIGITSSGHFWNKEDIRSIDIIE